MNLKSLNNKSLFVMGVLTFSPAAWAGDWARAVYDAMPVAPVESFNVLYKTIDNVQCFERRWTGWDIGWGCRFYGGKVTINENANSSRGTTLITNQVMAKIIFDSLDSSVSTVFGNSSKVVREKYDEMKCSKRFSRELNSNVYRCVYKTDW